MSKITTCQFIGDGHTACGAPTVPGRSYCEEHLFKVYQKGTARARRKKDERIANAVWNLEDEFNAAVEELVAEGFDI